MAQQPCFQPDQLAAAARAVESARLRREGQGWASAAVTGMAYRLRRQRRY